MEIAHFYSAFSWWICWLKYVQIFYVTYQAGSVLLLNQPRCPYEHFCLPQLLNKDIFGSPLTQVVPVAACVSQIACTSIWKEGSFFLKKSSISLDLYSWQNEFAKKNLNGTLTEGLIKVCDSASLIYWKKKTSFNQLYMLSSKKNLQPLNSRHRL